MEIVGLSFVSMLQELMQDIFNNVFAPVLRDVMNILIHIIGQMIQEILSNFLLKIWIILLKLIYFMENLFGIFSGINPVEVKNVSQRMTLPEYFFRLSEVQTAFLKITAIAVVLAFVTTLIAVSRSIGDMALENKTPLSQVLRQAFQASLTFLIIPFTCLFILQMVTQVTVILNSSLNSTQADTSMSDVLFISAGTGAIKNKRNIEAYSCGQKYENAEQVKKDFYIEKIDYLLAFISCILVFFLMLFCILQFIQRMIMLLLLYLASPFFVAYIPLDGGKKFKGWRDMFVAYMISAFGPIISMKLYFMIVPTLVGGEVDFGISGNALMCVRMILVIGGAFAVYKSRMLLITLVNPDAAGMIRECGFLGALIGEKTKGAVRSIVRKR